MTHPLGHQQKRILSMLSDGQMVHGHDIARELGVPHHILTAYINRLRWRGYEIKGRRGHGGYRMLCQQKGDM